MQREAGSYRETQGTVGSRRESWGAIGGPGRSKETLGVAGSRREKQEDSDNRRQSQGVAMEPQGTQKEQQGAPESPREPRFRLGRVEPRDLEDPALARVSSGAGSRRRPRP